MVQVLVGGDAPHDRAPGRIVEQLPGVAVRDGVASSCSVVYTSPAVGRSKYGVSPLATCCIRPRSSSTGSIDRVTVR